MAAADAEHRNPARPFRVDHAQLVRSGERLEVLADSIAALGRGVHDLVVEHDGACCRREPWDTTAGRLLDAMQRRRGRGSANVRLGLDGG